MVIILTCGDPWERTNGSLLCNPNRCGGMSANNPLTFNDMSNFVHVSEKLDMKTCMVLVADYSPCI